MSCCCQRLIEFAKKRNGTMEHVAFWHPGHGSADQVVIRLISDPVDAVVGTGATLEEALDDAEREISARGGF